MDSYNGEMRRIASRRPGKNSFGEQAGRERIDFLIEVKEFEAGEQLDSFRSLRGLTLASFIEHKLER